MTDIDFPVSETFRKYYEEIGLLPRTDDIDIQMRVITEHYVANTGCHQPMIYFNNLQQQVEYQKMIEFFDNELRRLYNIEKLYSELRSKNGKSTYQTQYNR